MIPEYYAVKCPKDWKTNELWEKCIDYMNSTGVCFEGSSINDYYGVTDSGSKNNWLDISYFSKATIFTPEEFVNLLEGTKIHELW
jgi:hypothetical protein